MNKIKQWILYNVMSSFWVIYTPSIHVFACERNGWKPKESYLDKDNNWTDNPKEAKRYWKHQYTINRYTRSKKITL